MLLFVILLFLQAELATLQSLLKGFSAEVMQLVLQMRSEQRSSSNSSSSSAAGWLSLPANKQPQQQQQQQLGAISDPTVAWGLDLPKQQQQHMQPHPMQQLAPAVPAAARLQRLLVQTQLAFRLFMVINRLSHYQLNNCNIETGEVDADVPAGHWANVAHMLRDG